MAINRLSYKLLLLGDRGVGKTSIRRRYLGQGFLREYSMTVGVDFAVRYLEKENVQYIIQVWDMAGQDAYTKFRGQYYNGAQGALLIFDISKPGSLKSLENWVAEVVRNVGTYIPLLIIGNKSDLRESVANCVTSEQIESYLQQLSEKIGFDVRYLETSALENTNIEIAFSKLLDVMDEKFGNVWTQD
ncbi:MAG: Rab family GTPase [Candidatus Kariarchaeaceae archaeon]|jgi:small GTP-binding protein